MAAAAPACPREHRDAVCEAVIDWLVQHSEGRGHTLYITSGHCDRCTHQGIVKALIQAIASLGLIPSQHSVLFAPPCRYWAVDDFILSTGDDDPHTIRVRNADDKGAAMFRFKRGPPAPLLQDVVPNDSLDDEEEEAVTVAFVRS